MELLQRFHHWQQKNIKHVSFPGKLLASREKLFGFTRYIKSLGFVPEMEDYEKRKLAIFNLLNFFQFITGTLVPFAGLFYIHSIPAASWMVSTIPAFVSLAVLFMNARKQYKTALLFYFIAYPVFTGIIYINGMNIGVELSFILYGILAVFFLQDIGYMLFTVGLSMISYFVLSVVLKDFQYQLKDINLFAYFLNQALAIAYIFYGLYLIKRENTGYQASIMRQKGEIAQQAVALTEANSLNNKLFSIIGHDLKTPMYAMRNLFNSAREMNMSAREIKDMLPDVINDLNYTTGLMENLLHWAKSQMQSNGVRSQQLDINYIIGDVMQLLRIQADAKKIRIERKTELPVLAYGDKDMISLVVRNLLSNAIKYTPHGGNITIGSHEHNGFAEVYVQDSGIGISREEMQKINEQNFYTTRGTDSESGTGLGLMLCKEFLERNNGRLMIESEPGKGSTFSFSLPQHP